MELVQQNRRGLQVLRFAIHFKLPLYVWFMLGVFLGILVMVAAVTALTRYMQPPSNPFLAYADLLPGQVASNLELHGFTCIEHNHIHDYPQIAPIYCNYRPPAGIFEHIAVTLAADHTIRLVAFTVRQDTLHLGDLALLWGRPPIMASAGDRMTLDWPGAQWSVLANTKRGRFSYFMLLHRVTFLAAS